MSTIVDLAGRMHAPRRMPLLRIAISFALLVLFLVLFAPSLFADARLYFAQYSNDRYAFYLDGGQTFFGTVRGAGFGKVILSDAYSFQEVAVGETTTSNLVAVADNPLTRPDNWVVLNRAHILFYEKIGEDASILNAIDTR